MAVQVASLFGVLRMRDEGFSAALREGRDGVKGLGDRLKDVGGQVTGFGTKLTLATAPIAIGLKSVVNAATDFEYQFADVVKTVDATDEQLAALRDTIRDMATDPANPLSSLENAHEVLAGIMSAGGQLGVATKDLEAFTATVAALDVATNLTAEEAGVQMAQIANIVKMGAEDFDNFASSLVRLGNNSATTEADIMAITARISAAGERAGLSEADILAFGAAISSAGISAELGGTNFGKFVNTITTATFTGGAKLETFAQVAGMTAEDFRKAYEDDAAGAIVTFLEGLNKLDPGQQAAKLDALGLTGEEVGRVVSTLAGNTDLLTRSLGHAADGWAAATDHMDEATAKAATTRGGWNALNNQLTDMRIEIGNALLPAFNEILTAISPIVMGITDWVAANPELTAQIGAIAAGLVVAGPLLAGVGLAITGIGTAVGLMMSPIGLVVGAVAGLAAAWATDFGGIRTFITETVWPAIQPFFDWLGSVWTDTIEPGLSDLYEWFTVTALPAVSDFVSNTVLPAIEDFANFLVGLWETVEPGLSDLYDWFVVTALPAVSDFVNNTVVPAIQWFIDVIAGAWDLIGPVLGDIYDWFVVTGMPAISGFINDTVVPAIQWFIDTANGIWTAIEPSITSLKNGILGLLQPIVDMINSVINGLNELRGLQAQAQDLQAKTGHLSDDELWNMTVNAANQQNLGMFTDLMARISYSQLRADGGPVTGGDSYIVGERGPELFVPRQSGTIVPNHALNSGGQGGARLEFAAGSVVIHANSMAEGAEAARGFAAELRLLMMEAG